MPKPLVIGVDVRDLRVAKTGTRTYLLEVCREFKKLQSESLQFEFLDTTTAVYTGNNKFLKWAEHLRYQTWKQVILPIKAWRKHCDIVFCTDNFVPLVHLGYKTIPVFHDAFFFETPEAYGKLWLYLYKKTALPAALRSPVVITPTQYAKKKLQHFTNIPGQKLKVVFEGARSLGENADEVDLTSLQLPIVSKHYILHAGSFFKRKNIPALVRAFSQLKATGYGGLKLVLAGPIPVNKAEDDYSEVIAAIEMCGLTDAVILTGYLPDSHLDALYKNALLYAFPSINEGFGIPILEAFNNNIPVVVANNSCLPEVGGNAVVTFNPFDTDDIARVLKKVLDDGQLREDMIARGQQRLKHFSWKQAALQLVEVFKTVANYR